MPKSPPPRGPGTSRWHTAQAWAVFSTEASTPHTQALPKISAGDLDGVHANVDPQEQPLYIFAINVLAGRVFTKDKAFQLVNLGFSRLCAQAAGCHPRR
jgi:hypothetical protein